MLGLENLEDWSACLGALICWEKHSSTVAVGQLSNCLAQAAGQDLLIEGTGACVLISTAWTGTGARQKGGLRVVNQGTVLALFPKGHPPVYASANILGRPNRRCSLQYCGNENLRPFRVPRAIANAAKLMCEDSQKPPTYTTSWEVISAGVVAD